MSKPISKFIKHYPLLISYAQKGLINFIALASFIKENDHEIDSSVSLTTIGMDIRRQVAKLPQSPVIPLDFSKYVLQLVARTNIQELILNKSSENRKQCLEIIQKISQTKHFISIVEGEKEMVLITDHPLKEILKQNNLEKNITHHTNDLGFISINFPIELRQAIGVYSFITTLLTEENISIHSFHTIGGEILLLVKNEDLTRTQEILQESLS